MQWLTEYVGTSAEMVQKRYGRFMRSGSSYPPAWMDGETVDPAGEGQPARSRKSVKSQPGREGD